MDYTHILNGHYLPADWAIELFKPCKDSWSLVVQTEKKIFSVSCRHFRPCLHNMMSTSHGSSTIKPFFWGITFEPEALETYSRALKTHILAYNPIKLWATILACWIGDDVIKKGKTYPTHDVINQKPQVQNLIFFSF